MEEEEEGKGKGVQHIAVKNSPLLRFKQKSIIKTKFVFVCINI